jgi:hypothetical protein
MDHPARGGHILAKLACSVESPHHRMVCGPGLVARGWDTIGLVEGEASLVAQAWGARRRQGSIYPTVSAHRSTPPARTSSLTWSVIPRSLARISA